MVIAYADPVYDASARTGVRKTILNALRERQWQWLPDAQLLATLRTWFASSGTMTTIYAAMMGRGRHNAASVSKRSSHRVTRSKSWFDRRSKAASRPVFFLLSLSSEHETPLADTTCRTIIGWTS